MRPAGTFRPPTHPGGGSGRHRDSEARCPRAPRHEPRRGAMPRRPMPVAREAPGARRRAAPVVRRCGYARGARRPHSANSSRGSRRRVHGISKLPAPPGPPTTDNSHALGSGAESTAASATRFALGDPHGWLRPVGGHGAAGSPDAAERGHSAGRAISRGTSFEGCLAQAIRGMGGRTQRRIWRAAGRLSLRFWPRNLSDLKAGRRTGPERRVRVPAPEQEQGLRAEPDERSGRRRRPPRWWRGAAPQLRVTATLHPAGLTVHRCGLRGGLSPTCGVRAFRSRRPGSAVVR
jgi:hypothetical protein